MIFRDLAFLNPYALYLLLALIPLLGLAQYLYLYRRKMVKPFQAPPKRRYYWAKLALLLACWTFATLALMEPSEHGSYPEETLKKHEVKRKVHTVIFAIDASASMSATDTPSKTTRLDVAKEIADEIIKKLPQENIALYAFTSDPTKLVPLTLNGLFLRLQLKNVQINEGDSVGTRFSPLFQEIARDTPASKTVILLSDGEDHGKPVTKIPNTRLIAIGVGSKEGQTLPDMDAHTALNADYLKTLAKETKGRYLQANTQTPLQIANAVQKWIEEEEAEEVVAQVPPTPYTLYFQIPLALAILFLGGALLLPDTSKSETFATRDRL